MTDPILRATTQRGEVWDDPSEDMLFELLSDIERGDEQYVIVERVSDPTHFIQATVATSGGFVVECREGGAESHIGTTADKRAAHQAMTKWAFGMSDWQGDLHWAPVTY